MEEQDKKDIAKLIAETLDDLSTKKCTYVKEEVCKDRTNVILREIKEVNNGVKEIGHTTTQLQIDVVGHLAEHRGESTGIRKIKSNDQFVVKLLSLILTALALLGAAIWTVANIN